MRWETAFWIVTALLFIVSAYAGWQWALLRSMRKHAEAVLKYAEAVDPDVWVDVPQQSQRVTMRVTNRGQAKPRPFHDKWPDGE